MKAAHGGAYVEDHKMAQIIRETDARKSHKEEKMIGERDSERFMVSPRG
jgi:hypothetical protein